MSKKRWTTQNIGDQSGRIAIVTGANSGIGFEAAKALADKGATVIVASRSVARAQAAIDQIVAELPHAKLELMQLDLANLDSVSRFVASFTARYDRLDLLINNAGVMMPPSRETTADGFEMQFGTNHLGHFALTLPLLPLLAQTEGSRIVNVSSSAQNFGKWDADDLQWETRRYDRMGSYGASKIANMLFTLELQRRLDGAGVDVLATACHPGWTATNLQKTSRAFRWLNPLFGMQPWQGALPTLYAALSSDVQGAGYYGPDGLGTMRGYPTQNKPAAVSRDASEARKLWDASVELTGVDMPELSASASSISA